MKRLFLLLSLSLSLLSAVSALPQQLSPRSAKLLKAPRAERADSMVSAYITVDEVALDRDALSALGVSIGVDLGSTLTARMPLTSVERLTEVAGVQYVQISSPVNQMLDEVRPEVHIDAVNSGASLSKPFTGAGVVVGIVDSGFDYGHAAFRDADGNLRIKRVWEQSATPFRSLSSPSKFGYGVEFTDANDILNAGGDIRNNSHGSHVTSLAAGSDFYFDGLYKGMAPDADIVLVSMVEAGGGNVNISDAIAYIFDYADQVNKPCVINLSLGSFSGPHDGTSTFDLIADKIQGPGRLIVGAVGNGRGTGSHLHKEFAGADAAPLLTFIDFKNTQMAQNVGEELDFWVQKDMGVEVSLAAYKLTAKDVVERVNVYPGTGEPSVNVSLGRNISGTIRVDSEVSPLNGKIHLLFTFEVTSIRTGYAIVLEVKPKDAGAVDVWSESGLVTFVTHGIDGFTGVTDESTVCEIGGTSKRILSVGAYTTRKDYVRLGDTSPLSLNETVGDLCSFSGNGPTADGRVKPQICAPGCYISAAVSSFDNSGTQVISQYFNQYDHDNYYGFMQGTSMATPIVTGIVATWLEAWPEMTPEDLADVVKATARTDEFTGDLTTPDNDWGYGKIDALAGVLECLRRSGQGGVSDVTVSSDDSQVVLTYSHDGDAALLFLCDLNDVAIDVYSIVGHCVSHNYYGDITASGVVKVPLNDVSKGNYIVCITSANGRVAYKINL